MGRIAGFARRSPILAFGINCSNDINVPVYGMQPLDAT
jgi:hypothetical protein